MPATDRVHSPTPEELMAFLDGESPADARAAIEAHVVACAECRQVISDLGGVNRAMSAWLPEEAPVTLRPPRVRHGNGWTLPAFSWRPGYLAVSFGAVAVTAVLVVNLARYSTPARPEKPGIGMPVALPAQASPETRNRAIDGRLERNGSVDRFGTVAGRLPGGGDGNRAPAAYVHSTNASRSAGIQEAQAGNTVPETVTVPRQPSVIRTATLRLVAKDFNAARASVESIVGQAGGFLDQITANGAPGSARILTGSLRVPAARLGDALTRLRQLGQVTEDTQGSEDVTDQLVDLEARLTNARATELRLNDILKNRTGKLSDVLEVEQEISRVRLEIEQMDAQRVNMGRRVTYATITLQIDEERKAGLESGPLSLGTRLRIATADGIEAAVETVVGAVLFILRAGPAILLWLAAGVFVWTIGRRIVRLKAEATKS